MKKTVLLICLLISVLPDLSAGRLRVRNVRSLHRAIGKVAPGDTIVLKKGTYRLKETIRLEGKKDIAIVGEGACISGGVRIPKWRLRRAKGLADGVKLLDTKRMNVAGVCQKGDPHLTGPSWSELFADGRPMNLSEWPDGNPLHLDSVVTTGKGYIRNQPGEGFGVITFKEDRPLEWKDPTKAWLYGCFRFGWTCELVPIKQLGPGKTIEAGALTNYGFGFKEGENFQRWKVLNVPEEVTVGGEYSIDTENNTVVMMLPEGTRTLEMSVMSEPLMILSGCSNVVVRGFEFTCTRGDAVKIIGCEDVRVENCSLHGLGHVAATIDVGSTRCGLSSCHLYDLGSGAVELAGGSRRDIVRGENYVEKCRIHNYNRIESQYRVGVVMSGLGNRITACEFYDSPSMAILMLGNDQTVEYCNIHHVCQDIEDNGALYHGRSFAQRGGVIRYNYFHDIEVPFNVRAVYHDDGSGATEVYGNVFQRIGTPPVQIGGGSFIRYHDNIFADIPCAAIKIDGRLKTWGADRLPLMIDSLRHADSPAFRAHYPELQAYLEGDPAEPQHNTLLDNVFCNTRWAIEKVVWSDHDYNNVIEGRANFFDEMRGNRIVGSGFELVLPEGVPPTSKPEIVFHHEGFSGINRGVMDELHTTFQGTSTP